MLTRAICSCCSFYACILIETRPCFGFILRRVNAKAMTTNTKKIKVCIIESAFFVPDSIVTIFPCFHSVNTLIRFPFSLPYRFTVQTLFFLCADLPPHMPTWPPSLQIAAKPAAVAIPGEYLMAILTSDAVIIA
jgi:hypothetical protein